MNWAFLKPSPLAIHDRTGKSSNPIPNSYLQANGIRDRPLIISTNNAHLGTNYYRRNCPGRHFHKADGNARTNAIPYPGRLVIA